MFKYAKANLALVNVYIDAPFAKKIVVDEKVPLISFIAQVSTNLFPLARGNYDKQLKTFCRYEVDFIRY